MAFTITRFRMSLFWSHRFATLLEDEVPPGAPLAALGRAESYDQLFSYLLGSPTKPVTPAVPGAPSLELPWPPVGTHLFWCRYLDANPIRRIKGAFAFGRLVPLRRHHSLVRDLQAALPVELANSCNAVVESVLGEAWFHSHMFSFAAHFTVSCSATPQQMAAVCLSLRRDRIIRRGGSLLKLDEVAVHSLLALYADAVGEANVGPLSPANPFSLVTILAANHGDPAPVVQDDPVHLLLEAVTQWDVRKVGPLDAGRISSRPATPAAAPLLFGNARSRAYWDPWRFGPAAGTPLSCYHRNLFVATLQTEALLAFARIADDQAAAGKRPNAIRYCEDPVLKRIIALHAGDDSTYRSLSMKRFIDDHPFRASVNTLSDRIWSQAKLPALAGATQPPA